MGKDDVLMRAIDDIIRELEWEGPQRWAPVIERLRRLVDDRRNESARRRGETASEPEPPSHEAAGPQG